MLQILLAEDNLGDVFLVQEALREHHVECDLHVVRDGSEAIKFIQGVDGPLAIRCPDLILLDINLPKADGPEILALVRKTAAICDVPVVVMTSSDSPKDRAVMTELKISSYFRKPLDYESFLKLGALARQVLELDSPSLS